ncbi:ABC transporter substrate binding protein [uncultured Draconibacterium sp.]|uniref:ABC transporter substrate-binding protein n=1 Tax=uncultured Draconibacterium sp. TaxID=1573823 RepID=UPI0029C90826|nr:ABC transporter substrate binding protein [uncultured Draconibacterium sp.]
MMKGINKVLESKEVEMKTFFMDSKQKSSEIEIAESVQKSLAEIEEFKPDLLLVSDDNAVKYIIQPYFNNKNIPVVFCGVNWSAEQYELGKNVTGMLEVLPLQELLKTVVSNYPDSKNLVVLSENSLSEQNNKTILDTLYRNLGLEPTYMLADNFEEWKKMFAEANRSADIIYMPTNGAIKGWDDAKAKKITEESLQIPAITCDDFMMPYVVFGLTKVASEQGEWAANRALEILGGKKAEEIPYAKNIQSKAWLNTKLANRIDFKLSEKTKLECTQL